MRAVTARGRACSVSGGRTASEFWRPESSGLDDHSDGGFQRRWSPVRAAGALEGDGGAWGIEAARERSLVVIWMIGQRGRMGFCDTKPMVWVVRHKNVV